MRLLPPDVVQSFPAPNYVDPVTRGNTLLVVNCVFISLVVIAVTLRLYDRIFRKRWVGVDDYLIALALVMTIAMTAVVLLANLKYGFNRHVYDIPTDMIQSAAIIGLVSKVMFTLASTFTRLSLIAFYYRLIGKSSMKWFAWIMHASLAWTVLVGILFVVLTVWQCVPIQAYWIFPPLENAKCLDDGVVTLTASAINCATDLLVTLLPIRIVMHLQMPLRQRIGVCILCSLGFIVTIAGIVRTYFVWKSLFETYDGTWYAYPLWIAATVEIDLAVICACAPAIKSLLQKQLAAWSNRISAKLSSWSSGSKRSYASTSSTSSKPVMLSSLHPKSVLGRMQRSSRVDSRHQHGKLEWDEEKSVTATEYCGDSKTRNGQHVGDDLPIRPSSPTLKITKRLSITMASE